MAAPHIAIRELQSLDEVRHAEQIQREIWKMPGDLEVVPLHLLVTAQKNGGLLLGAFDGDRMVGFLFGFLGRTATGAFKHCSHMLGVLEAYRGQGIGELLKRHQRAFVQRQGLDLITWTYDPLERANASLNVHKLGAICRTYLRNVYGDLRDDLNQGLPTDRFEVEWWIGREWARPHPGPALQTPGDLLALGLLPVVEVHTNAAGWLEPRDWRQADAAGLLVETPPRFQALKAQDMALARAWRLLTRDVFEAYFAAGYTVIDFLSVEDEGRQRCFYVLKRET